MDCARVLGRYVVPQSFVTFLAPRVSGDLEVVPGGTDSSARVDVTDVARASIARAELQTLYAHPAMRGLPLLILANKCDSSTASPLKPRPDGAGTLPLNAETVRTALALDTLQLHLRLDLKIIETSGESGKNIEAAFQWITDKVAW